MATSASATGRAVVAGEGAEAVFVMGRTLAAPVDMPPGGVTRSDEPAPARPYARAYAGGGSRGRGTPPSGPQRGDQGDDAAAQATPAPCAGPPLPREQRPPARGHPSAPPRPSRHARSPQQQQRPHGQRPPRTRGTPLRARRRTSTTPHPARHPSRLTPILRFVRHAQHAERMIMGGEGRHASLSHGRLFVGPSFGR
jgi:hypothetical protein